VRTIRELRAHASGALWTVERFTASPATQVDIEGSTEYYLAALSNPTGHAAIATAGFAPNDCPEP
jgi:hypothetical protein